MDEKVIKLKSLKEINNHKELSFRKKEKRKKRRGKKRKKPTKNNSNCNNNNNNNNNSKQKQQENIFYANVYCHLTKTLNMCPVLVSRLSSKSVSSSVAKLQMKIN